MTIIVSVFLNGYRGKTIDFAKAGTHHRTTIAHFLNHGKWNSSKLQEVLKANVIRIIYYEAVMSGQPIFCIVDDTIASYAKPSSQAEHPIEASYFLCDSWYTSAKIMDSFIRKGFYTVGALKTNRMILSYPREAFGEAKALRVFISTNVDLSTQEILDRYTCRWPIELFFRQSKNKLALDKYQIRTQTGIERYWLIMSLVHYMCCTCKGKYCAFEEGYKHLQNKMKEEQITILYRYIQNGMPLEDVLKLVG